MGLLFTLTGKYRRGEDLHPTVFRLSIVLVVLLYLFRHTSHFSLYSLHGAGATDNVGLEPTTPFGATT